MWRCTMDNTMNYRAASTENHILEPGDLYVTRLPAWPP